MAPPLCYEKLRPQALIFDLNRVAQDFAGAPQLAVEMMLQGRFDTATGSP